MTFGRALDTPWSSSCNCSRAGRNGSRLRSIQGKATPNSATVRLGNFENVRAAIEEELDKVWAGRATAQEALDEGVRKGNEILRRFEAQNRGKL